MRDNLEDIHTAILENNGVISVVPCASARESFRSGEAAVEQ